MHISKCGTGMMRLACQNQGSTISRFGACSRIFDTQDRRSASCHVHPSYESQHFASPMLKQSIEIF